MTILMVIALLMLMTWGRDEGPRDQPADTAL